MLELALHEQARVHLLALVQVDDALQFAAGLVRVVLEEVLAGQFALFQGEPSSSPALWGEGQGDESLREAIC